MSPEIKKLTGLSLPQPELLPAARWLAEKLGGEPPVVEFCAAQLERLEPNTIIVGKILEDHVDFTVDGMAADAESTHPFKVTVPLRYAPKSGTVVRIEQAPGG